MHSKIAKFIHNHNLVKHPFYHTNVDRQLKWIPFATVFLLDVFGLRTKSGWKKQLLITGATEAIRYFIADNLKKITKERRPAPYMGKHSFPSGHTSSSFAGAQFMHTELRNSIPVLSCVGYLGAMTTATIRLMKNRHWLMDVVAGAVVGIVSAKLADTIVHRLATKRQTKKKQSTQMNPQYDERFESAVNADY